MWRASGRPRAPDGRAPQDDTPPDRTAGLRQARGLQAPAMDGAADAAPARRRPTLSLKGRALQLLSRREHSRLELERKLAPHEAEPGELARVLDELQARGFIDEQRVIDSLLHQRAGRLGASRLRQELAAKGVDAEAAAHALAGLKESEPERARALWLRRFGAPPADARERGRQMRFLMARGFSAEVAARAMRAPPDEDEADGR